MNFLKIALRVLEDQRVQITAMVLVDAVVGVLAITGVLPDVLVDAGYLLLASIGAFMLAVLQAASRRPGTFESEVQ